MRVEMCVLGRGCWILEEVAVGCTWQRISSAEVPAGVGQVAARGGGPINRRCVWPMRVQFVCTFSGSWVFGSAV